VSQKFDDGNAALKGHGFPAVPYVFGDNVRRGLKPPPSKAPAAYSTFFRKLLSRSESVFENTGFSP
jgi:hypothetical protein